MSYINTPLVSVIIPVYNAETYLKECIGSAVCQTLQNIEIICVDDGSTDLSREIIADISRQNSKVKLICQENGGASKARNTALDAAKGEYVFFLDSDDFIDPDTLERLYTKAQAQSLDILFFNAQPFFQSQELEEKNQKYVSFYARKGDYSITCTGQKMFADMRKNREFLGSMCLVLIRRALIVTNKLSLYNGIICEDNLFIFQCTFLAQRAGYLADRFYHRRVRDNSVMTSQTSLKNVEGYLVCYSEMLNFLHDLQIEDGVEEMLCEYLYYSMYRNAFTAYQALPSDIRQESLTHGGICSNQFLYMLKRNAAMEAECQNLRRTVRKLQQKQLTGHTRNLLSGAIQCVKDHGLVYTLKLAVQKICRRLTRLDKALQKSKLYRILSYTPRKLVQGFRIFTQNGLMGGFRMTQVKIRQKIGTGAPLVSFILPVYNVEAFLEQCLDSLVTQSMRHIEIICVDDGSTDNSLRILQDYAAKDSRIRILTQKNQFAGAARNLGLEAARGEYVIFLDSDDFFSGELAKETYLAAKFKNADVVLFGAKHYDNETGKFREAKWLLNAAIAPQEQPFSALDCGKTLYRMTTPCPWTKMFRRAFVLEKGLQFQKLQNSNDVFFTYSALAMAERIAVVDKVLVYYRVGIKTSLQATKQKNPFCFYEAYLALYQQLQQIGASEDQLCSFANVALSGCLHNLRTAKHPDTRRQIFEALKAYIFRDLGIADRPDEDFYNKEYCRERKRILQLTFEEYSEV